MNDRIRTSHAFSAFSSSLEITNIEKKWYIHGVLSKVYQTQFFRYCPRNVATLVIDDDFLAKMPRNGYARHPS